LASTVGVEDAEVVVDLGGFTFELGQGAGVNGSVGAFDFGSGFFFCGSSFRGSRGFFSSRSSFFGRSSFSSRSFFSGRGFLSRSGIFRRRGGGGCSGGSGSFLSGFGFGGFGAFLGGTGFGLGRGFGVGFLFGFGFGLGFRFGFGGGFGFGAGFRLGFFAGGGFGGLLLGGGLRGFVFLLEAVDSAFGVDKFLVAGEERVGEGGDVEFHQRVLFTVDGRRFVGFHGRTRDKMLFVGHVQKDDFLIFGVNGRFHEIGW